MSSTNSALNNMRSLISFIAFFAIFSELTVLRSVMVHAELDVNIMEPSGGKAFHDASLTSDSSLYDNGQYLHNFNDDVESVPINGNSTIGSQFGKYSYVDEYMGAIDMYDPNNNNYDYGKWNTKFSIEIFHLVMYYFFSVYWILPIRPYSIRKC